MATTEASVEIRKQQLHVAVFPWLAFGHIIPFLELSKCIAENGGHKVSFLSTTRNIERLSSHISPLLNVVKLTLPYVKELPENAEATTDLHHPDGNHHLHKAFDGLQPEVTKFLNEESPDWIIYDVAPYWLPSVAADLGIRRAFFSVFTPWFIAFIGRSPDDLINGSDGRTTVEDFLTPPKWFPFPSKVCSRKHEVLSHMSAASSTSDVALTYRMGMVFKGSDCMFFRSYYEFEPQWLPLLEKLYHIPVVPVGLLPPKINQKDDKDDDDTWMSIKKWLDGQQKGHVVYVALGSEAKLTETQLRELALGLELSELPFLWVIIKPKSSPEFSDSNSGELPDGFVERTRNRGLVWTSWAPQLKILNHDSVGGFLTHCGPGSLVEGLMFGQPLIMLPLLGDQGLNARLLAEKHVGIEIPRNDEDGSFTKESVAGSLRSVLVDDEGEIYKEKARELRKMLNDTRLEKEYVSRFVEYLEKNSRVVAIDHES